METSLRAEWATLCKQSFTLLHFGAKVSPIFFKEYDRFYLFFSKPTI